MEDNSYYGYGQEDEDYCDEIEHSRILSKQHLRSNNRREHYTDAKRQSNAFDDSAQGVDDRPYSKKSNQ